MTEKTTINFVPEDAKKPCLLKPLIIAVVLIAAIGLIAKFGIADRLSAGSGVQEPGIAQASLKDDPAEDARNDLSALSYDYPTSADAGLADRTETLALIRTEFLPAGDMLLWSLIENDLTATMTVRSEQDAEQLINRLQDNPMVRSCAVTASAASHTGGGAVMVNLNVSLYSPSEQEFVSTAGNGENSAVPIDSTSALASIREAMSGKSDYTAELTGEIRSGNLLRRVFSLQFTASDSADLETVISSLLEGNAPCIIRDIRADSSAEDIISVNMTAEFYEPSADAATEG